MASAEASIRGALQDTVEVIAGLPEFKDAKLLLDLGGGYDLIFTSHSLFYQTSETLEGSLKKVYNALKDKGVLVINHWIRQKNKNSVVSSLWDLRLTLLGSPHYLYSKEECLDLLKKCGFVEKDIIHLPTSSNPTVIIVARKDNRRKCPHKSP